MLLISIISFHTILPLQSALVVGNSLILRILYNPIHNHTKFNTVKIIFGKFKSTFPSASSNFANCLLILRMAVMGVMIAIPTVLMVQMFRFFPDMYIMKAFIMIDRPGEVAKPMAICPFFCTIAIARCFSFGESSVVVVVLLLLLLD